MKRADLSPPLGSPGGPCRVVQRIRDRVRDPKLQEQLTKEVEIGKSLSNPEAAKVYEVEIEPLSQGLFKKVLLGPHSSYRMDLRSITVPMIQRAVQNFVKAMMDAKSRGEDTFFFHKNLLDRGESTEWDDPKQKLTIVLALAGPDVAKVVTTYWTGKKDPRPPRKCPILKEAEFRHIVRRTLSAEYRAPASALPGVQTFVQNPDGTQDRDPQWLHPSNPDGEKAHAGPKPRSRSFPQPAFNGPGGSGTAPDGKSLSQDKVRTKGQPGEEYGNPSLDWSKDGPHRRTLKGDFFLERAPAEGPDPTLRYDRATKPLQPPHGESGQSLNLHEVTDNPGSAKVIPQGHDFVNRQALKIGEIESLCGAGVTDRSDKVAVKLQRIDAANSTWTYQAQGSSGQTYKVKVKALPKSSNLRDPNKVDVLVSCSCPFWRWQGPEYHAKSRGYLLGRPRGTASTPDIMDPDPRQHGACKHALAVLKEVKGLVLPGRGRKRLGSVWREENLVQRIARRFITDSLSVNPPVRSLRIIP